GAKPMAERAGQVESLLKDGKPAAGLDAALVAMGAELDSLVARIKAGMGEPEPAAPASTLAPESVDRDALAADLRKLAALLAELDSSAEGAAEGAADRVAALGQGPAARNMLRLVA